MSAPLENDDCYSVVQEILLLTEPIVDLPG